MSLANRPHSKNVAAVVIPAIMQKGLLLPRPSDHLEIGRPMIYVTTAATRRYHPIPRVVFPRTISPKNGMRYSAPM